LEPPPPFVTAADGRGLDVLMTDTALASVFASGHYVGVIRQRGPKGYEAS
jgi:hypothetical protein